MCEQVEMFPAEIPRLRVLRAKKAELIQIWKRETRPKVKDEILDRIERTQYLIDEVIGMF